MARRWVMCALLAVSSGGGLWGQGTLPRTYLHNELLSQAPVVVRARYVDDKNLRRVQITAFEVIEVLRGAAGPRVLVGAMGERAGTFANLEKILFLKPMSSGQLHQLVDVIDLTERDAIVPRLIGRYVALEKDVNPVETQRTLVGLAFEALASSSLFARRLAVRELARINQQDGYLFGARDLTKLEALKGQVPRAEALRYRRFLDALNRRLASTFAGCETPFERGPERELFLRAIGRFRAEEEPARRGRLVDELVRTFGRKTRLFCEALLADDDPLLLKRAAWYLGEFAERPSVEPLLRTLQRVSAKDRPEPLAALGKIGDPKCIPSLQVMLESREHVEDVLLALARVGGVDVISLLEKYESALGNGPDDERHRENLRHLRSKEFEESETRRRMESRRAFPQ